MTAPFFADVAELADAQVSEACDGDIVEVQVLSSAPSYQGRVELFGSLFHLEAGEDPKTQRRQCPTRFSLSCCSLGRPDVNHDKLKRVGHWCLCVFVTLWFRLSPP